jgi:serine/threonine protein phosphatase PrpC
MRTGFLRGRDHVALGAIATLADRGVAVALSRGGAAKNYGYRDPNEDACAFAFTDHAWLVAVADGHWGSAGAELALQRILERHAPRWTSPAAIALADRWHAEAPDVAADLNTALVSARAQNDAVGRTTLALALVRPRERWWAALAIGDSHLFSADGEGAREVCGARPGDVIFVGDARLGPDRLARSTRSAIEDHAREPIVLATDGLSEVDIGVPDPAAAVAESIHDARRADPPRALSVARGLAERALAAQRKNAAGDNVATACIWLED